jgi:hypothetical protein
MTASAIHDHDLGITTLTLAFHLDEARACQYCEALPGRSCVTRSERRRRTPHSVRSADAALRRGEPFVIDLDGGGTVSFTPMP